MKESKPKDWHQFKEEYEETEDFDSEESETEEQSAEQSLLDHPSYIALTEKLTQTEQEKHDLWEKLTRIRAETDNQLRRIERDKDNAVTHANKELLCAMLPLGDSLEAALKLADKETDSSMHEGLELTIKLYTDLLQKFGVEQIDPLGLPFDPQYHEAMSIQEIAGSPPNIVVAVFQKGYKLGDRVIRPARVIVSKNKA